MGATYYRDQDQGTISDANQSAGVSGALNNRVIQTAALKS